MSETLPSFLDVMSPTKCDALLQTGEIRRDYAEKVLLAADRSSYESGWWWTQSSTNRSLVKFPSKQGINREFLKIWRLGRNNG